MARSPLQMRMATGRAATKNISVQSGGALAGYLAGGPQRFTYTAQQRPQLGVTAGGNLAGYVSGQTSQQLTVRRGGSLAAYLKRSQRRRYYPNQPRQPKGRPEGGEWRPFTAAQRAAFSALARARLVRDGQFTLPESAELDFSEVNQIANQLSGAGMATLAVLLPLFVHTLIDAVSEWLQQEQRRSEFGLRARGPRPSPLLLGERSDPLGPAPEGPSARRIR